MAFDLSSISRGSTAKKPRIVVFGDSGVGKTTFACSAPNPIVLRTEDGLGVLDVPHFPIATTFDDVMSAIGVLFTEDAGFGTLIIDSLDWLEPLIWADVCQANGVDSIEKMPYGKGYVEALTRWRMLMDGITALRDERDMFTILVAHSQLVRIEDPTQPAYDSHGLKLHKKAAALVEEFSDVIGYADLKTLTVSEDGGFNQKRTRAKTTGERILHLAPSPAFTSKSRYPMPASLPLEWSAFETALNQSVTAK